jgi:DNA-binding CsgD family transcriptional regulator
VLDGEAALPQALTARLIREYRDPVRRRQLPFLVSGKCIELTTREFEVLDHLRRGEPTAAIAGQLRISEVTVRRHISAILGKLGSLTGARRWSFSRAEDAGLETLCSAPASLGVPVRSVRRWLRRFVDNELPWDVPIDVASSATISGSIAPCRSSRRSSTRGLRGRSGRSAGRR